MSHRTWQKRLQDILQCSYNIKAFTNGMSYFMFISDPKTIRAVAFELTTIGEAVRAIPQNVQDQNPKIPWGRMLGIRNVLVHEYYRIDEEILWKTCQEDIPRLIEHLEAMAGSLE